jgi:polar amino acid transport system substrate-binding protein
MKSLKLCLLAAAALLATAATARADVITLRADEWCPYNCTPGSDKPGYGIEIVKEIFSKAGHTIDYSTVAWARALEECTKGNVVAVIGAAKKDAPQLVFPDSNFGMSDNTFVVKKGTNWRYAGPASLSQVKIGTVQGYAYEGEAGAALDKLVADKASVDVTGGENALEQNLKKLAAGRIDATVDAKAVLSYNIAKLNLGDKLEFAGTADPGQIFVAFAPGNPKAKEYAKLFDDGLAQMRASGRLKAILASYGVSDWK